MKILKKGKAKFEEELQQTHNLFKHFVEKYRPQLNVEKVATGEHWYGQDALDLNLVDQLKTSDEYLLSLLPQHDVYVIETRKKPTLGEKLGLQAAQIADSLVPAVISESDGIANKSQCEHGSIKRSKIMILSLCLIELLYRYKRSF